jgi:hypothetical protein
VLGRQIGRLVERRHETVHRGDVDDTAPAALSPGGQGSAGLLHQRGSGAGIRQVGPHIGRADIKLLRQPAGHLGPLCCGLNAVQHHIAATGGQAFGNGQSDALRRASDKGTAAKIRRGSGRGEEFIV